MIKTYIATGLENHAAHNALRDALVATGKFELTYDWTEHGSVQDQGIDRLQEVATSEIAGVMLAHLVIVLLPGGRGTHAELGIAIATAVPAIMLIAETPAPFGSNDGTCVFYHAQGVGHSVFHKDLDSMDALVDRIFKFCNLKNLK